MIERLRAQALPVEVQLTERIEAVRREKELAIETQKFELAAQMRDQERRLLQANAVLAPEVLQEIRQRLGIARTNKPPPPGPS